MSEVPPRRRRSESSKGIEEADAPAGTKKGPLVNEKKVEDSGEYPVVRFSNLHPQASDEEILDILCRKLKYSEAVRTYLVQQDSDRFAFAVFQSFDRCWCCWRACSDQRSIMIRGNRVVASICTADSTSDLANYSGFHQPVQTPQERFGVKRLKLGLNLASREKANSLGDGKEDERLSSTRSLYVGKLQKDKNEGDIRRIFNPYGPVISVKMCHSKTGLGYAFVELADLSRAERAKRTLDNKFLGTIRIIVNYCQVKPSKTLWVGGIPRDCTSDEVSDIFGQFGEIVSIQGDDDGPYRHIQFERMEDAETAFRSIRISELQGMFRDLKVDFSSIMLHSEDGNEVTWDMEEGECTPDSVHSDEKCCATEVVEETCSSHATIGPAQVRSDKDIEVCDYTECYNGPSYPEDRVTTYVWSGSFTLKGHNFPASMRFLSGNIDVIGNLLPDDEKQIQLKITRKLRLSKPLPNVMKYTGPKYDHGIFVAKSPLNPHSPEPETSEASQNFKGLVTYLKERDIAGVVVIQNDFVSGVAFAFPRCDFIVKLLKCRCPDSGIELTADMLVVVTILAV